MPLRGCRAIGEKKSFLPCSRGHASDAYPEALQSIPDPNCIVL
jgi:hypothetical protein